MADSAAPLLPIRVIAAMTGINPITLRTWERRYGLIRPRRTQSGHRLYTQSHVEEIRRVLALVERGVPISRVGEILAAERPDSTRVRNRWDRYLDEMVAAVSAFDEPEVERIHEEALSLYAAGTVTRRLVLPLLERLGERWRAIDGAVAEEHFFATYLRSKLGARLQHRSHHAAGPCLLAACAPGEHHELGLLLFGLEAQEAGFRTLLLGADTPMHDVGIARRRAAVSGVVLSSSIDPPPTFFDAELPALVREGSEPVFVGGSTSVRHARAIEAAGAIALGNDFDEAVRILGQRLLSRERKS